MITIISGLNNRKVVSSSDLDINIFFSPALMKQNLFFIVFVLSLSLSVAHTFFTSNPSEVVSEYRLRIFPVLIPIVDEPGVLKTINSLVVRVDISEIVPAITNRNIKRRG